MDSSQLPSKKEETVCLQCGSGERANAFVYCVKCLKFAIHRYCLPVLPKTLTEFVWWYCGDCEETSENSRPFVKTSSGNFFEASADVAKVITDTRMVPDSPSEDTDHSYIRAEPVIDPVWSEEASENSRPSKKSYFGPWSKEPWKENNENLLSEDDSSFEASANVAKVTANAEMVPDSPTNDTEDSDIRAEPVIDPVWSGSFNIETDNYLSCDGIVAHMSSKACDQARKEAELFSESLCMDLLPKTSVWPLSFQKSGPSDDNIALFFFASKKSYVKAFDCLVSEMRIKELALKVMANNAELLIFTSTELPTCYWELEGKIYLWGVFRKKQAPDSRNFMIQTAVICDYKITNKELSATSPISSLSDISSSGYVSWPMSLH